jgi:hypothetical protein
MGLGALMKENEMKMGMGMVENVETGREEKRNEKWKVRK